MASISGNTSWMTSFFFEQDLRSQYMNGVLNAGLKPGIYNPNICLYTRDATSNTELTKDANGVNLFIRKGTTFVFSNNYEQKGGSNSTNEPYERNLNNVGTYLIKCFAMEDIVVNLINASTLNNTAKKILGNSTNEPAAPVFYVVASIMYNPDDSTGESIPEFRCVIPNNSITEGSRYFENADKESAWKIPEGPNSIEPSEKYISYLIIGAVKDVSSDPSTYYMASKGGWKAAIQGSSENNTGDVLWSKNHVFIGRGLQEYRQNLVANKTIMSPELIPNPDLRTFTLDLPNTFINDVLIDKPFEYSSVWGIRGRNPQLNGIKSTLATYEDVRSSLQTGDGDFLIWDFYFLNSRSRYSELEDLKNILREYNLEGNDLEIKHVAVATRIEESDLIDFMNPSYDSESDGGGNQSNVQHWVYLSDKGSPAKDYLKGKKLIPLDVNDLNTDRLLKLIKNKSIVPQIINYLRKNNELNIEKTTTLLPLAIAFRKVSKRQSNLMDGGKSVDDIGCLSEDEATNKVHPCNILSLLDLQYKTSQINVSTIKSQDIYSVLPVQE